MSLLEEQESLAAPVREGLVERLAASVADQHLVQHRRVVAIERDDAADVYVLGAKEGGRHTPFGTGYMPQFFFGATDVTGILDVSGDAVQPGERTRVGFRLQHAVGIEPGMRFALREGKRTVGAGIVLSVE